MNLREITIYGNIKYLGTIFNTTTVTINQNFQENLNR